MIWDLMTIVILGSVGYTAYRLYRFYPSVQGTWWDKLKASATLAWSYVVGIGASLYAILPSIADFFNMTEVKTWLQAHTSPEGFGAAVVVIAAVTVIARLRTL